MPEPTAVAQPADAEIRRAQRKGVVYPTAGRPGVDLELYARAREGMEKISELIVAPRDGEAFEVHAGHFFRIACIEGPQVGDFNLWNAHDLAESFFSGKTRAIHATHLTVGDRLWSALPYLRPLATITYDTLQWYGWDEDGCGVHDVIGTRCDPYINRMLRGTDAHHYCHSNLIRALVKQRGLPVPEAERRVHDVLNVFMCTGFDRETHQYIKKASPVRPGDFLEFFAEIDLLGALSACPAGDCGVREPGEEPRCFPLRVEIYRPRADLLDGWSPPGRNAYCGGHGVHARTPSPHKQN
jgi:uncharacterized protein YcgI (DUF1989 family)